ncbi:hypothetical protein M1L60_13550 [Actinoplanes sp. TRM 88003]|uniref:Lipoprotein n=1 Tax=Paractinoplanes aksuensis TaxID=2939490 RepID=A0ABT1DPE5_9ACTN|nr:hypothetical protein [Actinoplanes aksuensis]MCO8271616.1 hypothetical protein [Actinoplanes aksuensis]
MPSPNSRHPSRIVPVLAALTALLLGGCDGPDATAAAPASSPATAAPSPTELPPADAVKIALRRLSTTTYSYSVKGDYWDGQKYTAFGSHDPKARKNSRGYVISGGKNARMGKMLVIGDESYENRIGTNRWTRADLTRLAPSNHYRNADPKDPSGLTRFAAAIHSTHRLDARTYEGSALLEITPSALTYLPLGAPLYRFKQGSQWVAYTLTTNAGGDVTSIRTLIEIGQHQPVIATTTFSNLGRPVQVTRPARATELRRSLYDK